MQTKPLDTRWIRQISDKEAKDNFEKLVRNSTLLLSRLKEIIEERERELHAKAFSESDFDSSSWSHKQAARLGRLAELKAFKDLIPF